MILEKVRVVDNASVNENQTVAICDICRQVVMDIYEFHTCQLGEELWACGWRFENGVLYCRACVNEFIVESWK